MADPSRNLALNLALEHELLRVVRHLSAARIEHVVLKGVPLVRHLGLDLGRRSILDNDILVRRESVAAAADCLAKIGYEPPRTWTLASAIRHNFQYPLRRPGFLLELHWSIAHPALYPDAERVPWRYVHRSTLRGVSVPVLSAHMTAVHLAAHHAQHYFRQSRILEEFETAIAVDDLVPAEVLSVANEAGLDRAVEVCLRLIGRAVPRNRRTVRARAAAHLIKTANPRCLPPLAISLAPIQRIPRYLHAIALPPPDHAAMTEGTSPFPRLRRLIRIFRSALNSD